jgi:hypothetical protein
MAGIPGASAPILPAARSGVTGRSPQHNAYTRGESLGEFALEACHIALLGNPEVLIRYISVQAEDAHLQALGSSSGMDCQAQESRRNSG